MTHDSLPPTPPPSGRGRWFVAALCAAALVPALLAGGCGEGPSRSPSSPSPADAVVPATPLDAVLAGGSVVFFRHAERDANAMSTAVLAAADNAGECRPGSELSPAGIADSEAIGRSFARRGIRIQAVYASPTCRTVQMATLAFGAFQTTRILTWPDMWQPDEGAVLAVELRALLGTRPASGQTIVLVSHNNVLKADRVGIEVSLEQAEAAVFRPLGGQAFEFIGKVPLQEWVREP
ncbi:MAG TPA: histidine phosphatase family protein [Vicinamibacterales bacterium]|nr:histidine phosphatase family protein [Vicinamibacterales bacterium]